MHAAAPEPQWLSDSAGANSITNGSDNMPKLKNNRGAAKRFARTASGHFKNKPSHLRHILTKKSPKRKRALRQKDILKAQDSGHVRQMLPYS